MVCTLAVALGLFIEFIDINRSQKILRWVAGIKSILWILAILRGGVYGVMGLFSLCMQNSLSGSCQTLNSPPCKRHGL